MYTAIAYKDIKCAVNKKLRLFVKIFCKFTLYCKKKLFYRRVKYYCLKYEHSQLWSDFVFNSEMKTSDLIRKWKIFSWKHRRSYAIKGLRTAFKLCSTTSRGLFSNIRRFCKKYKKFDMNRSVNIKWLFQKKVHSVAQRQKQ